MPIQHSALIPESPTVNANTRIRSLTEPSTKTVAKSFSCTRSMARHSVMTFCFFWYVGFAFLCWFCAGLCWSLPVSLFCAGFVLVALLAFSWLGSSLSSPPCLHLPPSPLIAQQSMSSWSTMPIRLLLAIFATALIDFMPLMKTEHLRKVCVILSGFGLVCVGLAVLV